MDLRETAIIAAASAAVAAFCGWRGARPPNVHRGPRMVPWRVLMVVFSFVTFLMVVHLVNLGGVSTGR